MKTPKWVTGNSTSILSGLAVAGVVATAGLAIRATPKAMKKLGIAKDLKTRSWESTPDDEATEDLKDLTPVEIIKETWKDYLPATICGAATITCIIGANRIGLRRNAAILAAYTVVQGAFSDYKDEVLRVIGEKKEQEVRDGVAERHVKENPADSQVIILGGGDQLCYDDLTGRYFQSNAEAIRRAENDLRSRILHDMFVDHNVWYELLSLEPVTLGDALGWNIDHQPDIILSSHLSPDGRACLAVQFRELPKVDYLKY